MSHPNDTAVEQAMEEGKEIGMAPAHAKKASRSSSSKSLTYYAVMIAFIVMAALAIGLGAGLSQRDSKSDSETSASVDSPPATVEKVRISDATTRSLSLISGDSIKKTYLDCDDATVDVRKALLTMANQTIQNHLQSWYFKGDSDGPVFFPTVDFADDGSGGENVTVSAPVPEQEAARGSAASGPSVATTEDSFGTNNQVEGVEEPDAVQSDGVDIFAAYGAEIVKVNVADQDISLRTKLPEDDCNAQNVLSMLLIKDRLVVFSGGWCVQDNGVDEGAPIGIADSWIIGPPIYGTEITKVTIYDTNTLKVVGTPQEFDGSYINARAIGDDVYLVTSRSLNVYPFLGRLDPWMIANDENVQGEKRLNATDFEEMAWTIAEETVDKYVEQLLEDLECETLQQITLFQNSEAILPYGGIMESIATVNGFSVSDPSTISSSSRVMPTSSWQIYASASTLVLTAQGHYWISDDVESETYVMAYNLDNGNVEPLGLGTIPGYLLNQFSIDEHNGYLRFASSIQQRWRWFGDGRSWESTPADEGDNMIVVLKVPANGEGDAVMERVGELKGLGKPGERIYSVRFQGDRAFVVTFEETDPFYTINMEDPTDPQQVGELEIPGFSNYLHPMGDTHLIGVGQYVEEERTGGLQISLFDVSDFANPLRVANYIEEGGDGSSSEAQYNHQAFRLLDNGLLILPVQVYDWNRLWDGDTAEQQGDDDAFDGFKVYYVDNGENPAVSPYYEISHGSNYYNGCWSFNGYLAARSLVFQGNLWTLKTHTILVHDLTNRVQVGDAAINLDEDLKEDECTPYYFRGGPEIIVD